MTLARLSDDAALPADELAAHLGELISHRLVVREVAQDGLDIYRFPDEYQRGAMAPSANRRAAWGNRPDQALASGLLCRGDQVLA